VSLESGSSSRCIHKSRKTSGYFGLRRRLPAIYLLALFTVISLLRGRAVAQHPYLWLDATERTPIRNKAASNTADWQALRAQCDAMAGVGSIPYAVEYPQAVDPITAGSISGAGEERSENTSEDTRWR
jgi:hypothetical protein